MEMVCKQCGKEFTLTEGEIEFYQSKNLELTKRCKECRDSNKKKKNESDSIKNNESVNKKEMETKETKNLMEKGNVPNNSTQEKTPKNKKTPVATGIVTFVVVVIVALTNFLGGNTEESKGTTEPAPITQDAQISQDEQINQDTQISQDAPITQDSSTPQDVSSDQKQSNLSFRNDNLFYSHYEKHGIEMGFESADEYLKAANAVVAHPDVLHKYEAEDGDDVYFLESTGEFVVVSTDGYIRTYYYADKDYFDRQ